jgi:hypothetical protein
MSSSTQAQLIRRFRIVLGVFIVALVLSGVTAFPLRSELNVVATWLGIAPGAEVASLSGLKYWIAYVRSGLEQTYATYPFIAYGTDWLAFAHLAIAVFFIGPLREPERHDWILISGIIACAGILPLALVCGPLRGIPVYWQLIDCSFGIFGVVPLLYCLRISKLLKQSRANDSAD